MKKYGVNALVLGLFGSMCTGCFSNDAAVIQALQHLTDGKRDQANERNEELVSLADEVANCEAGIAHARRKPPVIKTRDVTVEVPSFTEEPEVESLEAYKAALDATLAEQKDQLKDLKEERDDCAEELAEVKTRRRYAPTQKQKPAKAATKTDDSEKKVSGAGRRIDFGMRY